MSNLFESFRFAERAERTVIDSYRDGQCVASYTYGKLRDMAADYAAELDRAGVKPGDRIVVRVEKSVEALAVYLASLQRGAVFVPLNTAYRPQEVEYFLRDSGARLVVCDPSDVEAVASVAAEIGAEVRTLDSSGQGSITNVTGDRNYDIVPREDKDLAAILYTSGTTGKPKGAMLSHANLRSNAEALKELWRMGEDDVLLHALPIYHVHGLFVGCNQMMMVGARMLFLPKFELDSMIALLPSATVLMGIPTFYTRLLGDPRLDRDLVANIRLFISGSAPLLAETHVEWQERTGHAILERYGMTETGMNTSNPYDGERRAGTVGFPLPGVELRVTHPETGEELPQGEIGMIEVRGPNVFSGYWQMPEKTAAELRENGFFITGDLGKIDERGYVHIVGRGKDLVITGGLNVYPKEVEIEIDAIPQVQESAVIGLPHADFGEAVTAVIVLRKGETLEEADVIAALKPRLASFKLPKRVIFLPELPRNTMGKVQKAELRNIYAGLYKA
ncbi:malonyl-CoA synthase [Daeguia caeni]|uniref:Malonyl-CoA synthase n=1 Tax=Daeguia caeni TaxID=439612 RepID=A0ABV9H1Y9_9HYPH